LIVLVFCKTGFDRDVAAVEVARFTQAAAKRGGEIGPVILAERVQKPDDGEGRLLRARGNGPCCRAAEQRDEAAPSQLTKFHQVAAIREGSQHTEGR